MGGANRAASVQIPINAPFWGHAIQIAKLFWRSGKKGLSDAYKQLLMLLGDELAAGVVLRNPVDGEREGLFPRT